MRTVNERLRQQKKIDIMEKCYNCYAEYGFNHVGLKGLARACGISSGSLYTYFEDLDDLIIQSTEYCMSKVEDEFMAKAPTSAQDIWRFIDEIPFWTAENHGKKYRLMYQIYTNPRYISYGKRFFDGVNERYTKYAKELEPKIGIPYTVIVALIFLFVRACVHYALFEDKYYLNAQITVLKQSITLILENRNSDVIRDIRMPNGMETTEIRNIPLPNSTEKTESERSEVSDGIGSVRSDP